MIKDFLCQQPDLKIDGYYVSLQSIKVQSLTDDYSQIFVDFGVTQKLKHKVLFVNCLANQDLDSEPDKKGFFLFDFSCQPPAPLM